MDETNLKEKLEGRHILVIGVKFYYYNEEILKKFRAAGARVTFFYERDISFVFGLVKYFRPGSVDEMQHRHYEGITQKIEGETFDYLLVIRGYKMQGEFVTRVKQLNPGIRTLLYQWDSYRLWDCDYRHLMPFFDGVATFDFQDAEELSIPYIPTFSLDVFRDISVSKTDYDLFYSGNYTYPRYLFLIQLVQLAKQQGYRLNTRLVMSRKTYLQERWRGVKLDPALLSFRKLSKGEYEDLFARSLVIVDFTDEKQTGLTMRTLDVLCAGKKLLTNNKNVFKEPGLNPDQIRVYNPRELRIDPEFVGEADFERKNYSIERWLGRIFAL